MTLQQTESLDGGSPVKAGSSDLKERLGRLAMLTPIVFMVLFFAVPMALTVVFSVFERTMFWMEPGFTLFSYENFFFSARLNNFLASMKYSLISVIICFVLGFPIAVFVRKSVPKVAQHRVVLLFILPFMVSEIIRVFALRPVLQRNGLLNTTLMDLGLIDEPITALLYSHTGVIIGEVMSFLPFIVFSSFLAMEAVPKFIFEVCDDLGVGPWHRFKDIVLPLAAPGVFAGSVFIFVNGLGVALLPNILGGAGAVNAGLIATQAIAALDFPLAMAVSAIMMATLMTLLYIGHRLFDLTKILTPLN
jgi:ABC-type spermidine/putrescine transport system permease subunit I